MRSTLELLLDLVRQGRELALVELSLARAEMGERGRSIPSSLAFLAVGLILLPVGLSLIFVALAMSLLRFGLPLDLAFAIVAAIVIVAGALMAYLGAQGLKPSRLVPARSISQITSLLGGQ